MSSLHKNLLQLTQRRVQQDNLLMKPRFINPTMDHIHALTTGPVTTSTTIDPAIIANRRADPLGKEIRVWQ